jgi:hypothetical protein
LKLSNVRTARHHGPSLGDILAHVEGILHQCLPIFALDVQDLV